MIKEAGVYNKISQAYAALDTNKAVGVMVSVQQYKPPPAETGSKSRAKCVLKHRATNARKGI
jgi:GMP synthase PP-ATPase subunit